jgi:hypothetical protein
MRRVVVRIDWSDDGNSLVGDNAISDENTSGGKTSGDTYRFTYFAKDQTSRWNIALREQQIRDIAGGELSEIDAERDDISTRAAKGDPLIIWGTYPDDAMRVRTERELGIALDALYAAAAQPDAAKSLRLWSRLDDQLFAVIYGEQCAIYVVQTSDGGYGTTAGDHTRTEAFDITDHDVGTLTIPWADCVPWPDARKALIGFAETGELGLELDYRMPSALLILGDTSREHELETRGQPAADPSRTSLVRINPYTRWARRLIDALRTLELIELLDVAVDGVTLQVAATLASHGDEAVDSLRMAERVAKEIGALRGVDRIFATPGDLQVALRRTQAD